MIDSIQHAMNQVGLQSHELEGQVAVVTGSGSGIGRAVAFALGLAGARVVVAELAETGRETAELIRLRGGDALYHQTDVAEEESVARLASAVHDAYGEVSILINNAILCPVARLEYLDLALWDRVMAVNLRGAFLTARAFVPQMRRRGGGTVINMVSTDAMPGLSAYIASKQGLVGLTQSLAVEVGQEGIHVIAFGPGMVDTQGLRSAGADLAPMLGMTTDQFFGLSLHPAYDGLMPVEHAGVATAYLAARLAPEYHGESVNGYTILERAGLIQPPVPGVSRVADSTDTASAPRGQDELLRLCGRLKAILDETEADFAKLPIFVRPLARSGFKSKAGQSLQDWQRTATQLLEQAEQGELADRARHRSLLEQLIRYIEGVPAETARFTKDQAFLQQVQERTNQYAAEMRALMEHL